MVDRKQNNKFNVEFTLRILGWIQIREARSFFNNNKYESFTPQIQSLKNIETFINSLKNLLHVNKRKKRKIMRDVTDERYVIPRFVERKRF